VFRDILTTIGTRYLVALLNVLLIFINSKVLGREGIGMVGILYTSANIAVIFNSILCGNTIVYFMNRYNLRYVFFPAYGWTFAGSAAACGAMYLLGLLPDGYGTAVFALAALMSLAGANTLMLLGKNRVKSFNRVFALQGICLFAVLLYIYYMADCKSVNGYLAGLFIAHFLACLYSLALLLPGLPKRKNAPVDVRFRRVLKEMFIYGLWSGADNLAENLAMRLNYFLIKSAGGYGSVGLLDAGSRISESVWHISNSVSYIEYKRVSETTDRHVQRRVTLQLFKFTACALAAVMAVFVCLPEWIYTDYLLSGEFAGIRKVIAGLSPGIVAFGCNRILSHYFIGSGRIKYSAFTSAVGLVVLLVAGTALIPRLGVFGAALTSSIAYTGMLFFSLTVFMKQTGAPAKELLPSSEDWMELRGKIGELVRRRRK
jgi:O-antigen/teichoic acid export membrane protein